MTTSSLAALLGRSLRRRATVACALCSLAEGQFYAGQRERALETVRTLRVVLSDAWLILSGETSAVPLSDLHEAAELLADLNPRITAMEEASGPETIQ